MLASILVRVAVVVLLGLGVYAMGLWQRHPMSTALEVAPAIWPVPQGLGSGQWELEAQGRIPMPVNTLAAHASNLLAMPAGHAAAVTAFWFAGDRESAPNVQIAASQWSRAHQQWSPARFVVNRHTAAQALGFGVRRLGNPVAWIDGDGRLHLFVVATGFGGWAASRILQLRETHAGVGDLIFEPVRVLPLSWFWNISYLVRNPPLSLADGGMVLPVHFELGRKFSSALRFDRHGQFLGMNRISMQSDRLQPSLVMRSPSNWLALMRVQRENGKIAAAQTTDAGLHWSDLPDLPLDNPDAAVVGLGISPDRAVLAHNPSTKNRIMLQLSESTGNGPWTAAAVLDKGADSSEYSYPAIAWDGEKLWVSYTADRTHIEWKRFSTGGVHGELQR